MIEFFIPLRTYSELNLAGHEYWRKTDRRRKGQAAIAYPFALQKIGNREKTGTNYAIKLTRIAPRKCDEGNLAACFKGFQDGIAAAIGIDDGSARITWTYAQRPARGWEERYGVQVRFEESDK